MRAVTFVPLLGCTLAGCEAITSGYAVRAGDAGPLTDAGGGDGMDESDADAAPHDDGTTQEGSTRDINQPPAEGGADGGSCATTMAPAFTGSYSNGPQGIVFHATANVTLTKFTFHNDGKADTVVLVDPTSCSVLASVQVPASSPLFTASVSWSLVANKKYALFSLQINGYNDYYALATYPWPSGNLVVDSDIESCPADAGPVGETGNYWGAFSDLVACQ